MRNFIANKDAIAWMREHAAEFAEKHKHSPVYQLASKAAYDFAEDHGLGCFGDYISYLYYHQAAEIFKEMGLNPGKNDITHEANYSAGCARYH